MEKDFCHKYQQRKLFRRIRNQTAAHAQKGVKCPLNGHHIDAVGGDLHLTPDGNLSDPKQLASRLYEVYTILRFFFPFIVRISPHISCASLFN